MQGSPTHEPLGLRSKSNRKCSRKPNKVILMIAFSTGSLRCKSETSLYHLLSCLVKAKHFPAKVEKRKQKVRGVEINNINHWVALHSSNALPVWRRQDQTWTNSQGIVIIPVITLIQQHHHHQYVCWFLKNSGTCSCLLLIINTSTVI